MTASTAVRGVVPRGVALATFAGTFLTGLLLDVATKVWAVSALTPETPVRVLGDLLRLYLIRNPGAAFSLGEGHTWVFTVLACLVLAYLLGRVVPRLRHRGWAAGVGLVTAGISGNLVDRMLRPPAPGVGHVVDFLQLPYWPVFNVADMCVTGGAAWLVLVMFRAGVSYDGQPDESGRAQPRAPEPEDAR